MGPYFSFAEYLERLARLSVVYGFLSLLFFLNVIAVPYPLALFFNAPLLLIALYYWSIYRPMLLPPWLVFAAGMLIDLLTDMPYTGLSAALFLLCRMAVVSQRRFLLGQGFVMVWLGFGFVVLGFYAVQWGCGSLFKMQILPLGDFVRLFVFGVILFPFVYLFLFLTHKLLPPPTDKMQRRVGIQA